MNKKLSLNIIKIISKYSNLNYFKEKHLHTVADKVNWINLSGNTNIPYTFFEEKYIEINTPKYLWSCLKSSNVYSSSVYSRYLL